MPTCSFVFLFLGICRTTWICGWIFFIDFFNPIHFSSNISLGLLGFQLDVCQTFFLTIHYMSSVSFSIFLISFSVCFNMNIFYWPILYLLNFPSKILLSLSTEFFFLFFNYTITIWFFFEKKSSSSSPFLITSIFGFLGDVSVVCFFVLFFSLSLLVFSASCFACEFFIECQTSYMQNI